MKFVPLFWLLSFLSYQGLAQTPDCQTFQSAGGKTLTVDPSYGGYYVIAFGLRGDAANASLTVSGARESADGGADFHLTFTQQDLPAELPTGIVNGLQFALMTTAGEAPEFWVMLGNSPQACRSTATPILGAASPENGPTPGSTQADPIPSSYLALMIAIAIALLLALVAYILRKQAP